MKTKSFLYAMVSALLMGSTTAHAVNTFSGRAFVAQVKLLGVDVTLVDTGPLPNRGGTLSEALPDLDFLGISAELLSASTSGGGQTATSSAELANLVVDLVVIQRDNA